jgi:hypothetical protein
MATEPGATESSMTAAETAMAAATTKSRVAASTAATMPSTLGIDRHYRKNKEERREGQKATHNDILLLNPCRQRKNRNPDSPQKTRRTRDTLDLIVLVVLAKKLLGGEML